jgi:hypothetical protein
VIDRAPNRQCARDYRRALEIGRGTARCSIQKIALRS